MHEVSEQLRSAQRAYRSVRYPSDLSDELLPRRLIPARFRWVVASGVGAGIAAAVVLSLLLSRGTDLPMAEPPGPAGGALVDSLPIGPGRVPLPRFGTPALPVRPPELRLPLDVPRRVEAYQDLAMQYRELRLDEQFRHTTVPTIPTDLPTRGVEWLQKVWTGDKSA